MTHRILLGNLGDGNYGLKISTPGNDVTSTSLDNMLIDTSSSFSRVVTRGTLVFGAGGSSTQTASIPTVGTTAPLVLFRYMELYLGDTYIFPMYTDNNNGWTASATDGLITVTKNFTTSVSKYICYFVLTTPGAS